MTDPLGLDQTQVSVGFAGGDALIAPSAVPGDAQAAFSFDDFDIPDLPISPAGLSNELSVASATLDTVDGPETITLEDADIRIQIWHGAATYGQADAGQRAELELQTAGDITLVRDECGGGSCTYEYEGASPAFGVISLSGSQLTAAMQVVTQAPTSNSGTLSLTVSGEPDTLAGHTLTITIDAASGQISF